MKKRLGVSFVRFMVKRLLKSLVATIVFASFTQGVSAYPVNQAESENTTNENKRGIVIRNSTIVVNDESALESLQGVHHINSNVVVDTEYYQKEENVQSLNVFSLENFQQIVFTPVCFIAPDFMVCQD